MERKAQGLSVGLAVKTSSVVRSAESAFAGDWKSWVFVIIAATIASMLLRQGPVFETHPHPFLSGLLSSFIFSACIGSLMFYTASQSWAYISGRPFPLNWILLIGSILLAATVGTMISGWVVIGVGEHSPGEYVAITRRSFRFSLMLSLFFGISFYLYQNLRAKLEAATMQLHARQLAEERARKTAIAAQLSSLESRVRPHFLFNTLNSISSLIREQPERAERMVEQLAALLRYSLDTNEGRRVPLRQELRLVNDYLAIEQARFNSRLRFSIDVPDELNAYGIPPFALQTLIENSVKHAIAPRRSGGEIRVVAQDDGDSIILEVHDDGPGFSPEAIRAGHGLDILQARLRSLYGNRAKLEFATIESGSTVSITLPRHYTEA
jgi:sensor histidine kinase YesM